MCPSMDNFIVHPGISEHTALQFWAKLPHAGDFWGDYAGTDREGFVKLLVDSLLVIELPFGLIRVASYQVGGAAHIHAVFWGKEALRSRGLFDSVAEWLEKYLGVTRITLVIPARSNSLRKLLPRLGFSEFSYLPDFYHTTHGCFDGILYARMATGG